MRIKEVEESGYKLIVEGTRVTFKDKGCLGFQFDRGACILQVARDLRNFLLRGVQVTLCNGRFDFHNSDDPEALRAHLTAWGTKGKTVEEVEDEIIKWLKDQPKKSTVTLDTWECNGYRIIKVHFDLSTHNYYVYKGGRLQLCTPNLQEALKSCQ